MSEKLKPIVPGCLAVIINADPLTGTEVTALKFVGTDSRFLDSDLWEIDKVLPAPQKGYKSNLVPERYLMRIDPDEDAKEVFLEELSPKKETT